MTATTDQRGSAPLPAGEDLERRLDELLAQERFVPSASFVGGALVRDGSLHERAERDPDGFWAEEVRGLHWDVSFSMVLDDVDLPFYKWFTDGKLNVSYNCVDRHVEAGLGARVAFYWAGEEGEERAITYGDLHRDV